MRHEIRREFIRDTNKTCRRPRRHPRQFSMEQLEGRRLLSCADANQLFHDDFDNGDLRLNDDEGWSTAQFGALGFETESSYRFDGRNADDWSLFEISSQDTFDVWNDEPTTFEFRSGNAVIVQDNPTENGDVDLQTQFGVLSAREPRSGSGGLPDHNEANLFQNTAGGVWVELHYRSKRNLQYVVVDGIIRFSNQLKLPWSADDAGPGLFSPVEFRLPKYDGQAELITRISIDNSRWSIDFNYDVEIDPMVGGMSISTHGVSGNWTRDTLQDATISDEFLEGAYPLAMGQNYAMGRGTVDLHAVTVCRQTTPPFAPDLLEPNNTAQQPFDLGTGDQYVDLLSLHDADDEDWYRWTSGNDGLLQVSLDSDIEYGDIDLELYNQNLDLLSVSATTDSHEGITWQVRADESYLLRVKAFASSAQPSYTLATSNRPITGEVIYVAVGHEVRMYNSRGHLIGTLRDPILESGDLADVEIGPEGFVYVSLDVGGDAGEDGKIVQFSPTGKRLGVLSLPSDPFVRQARYPFGFDVLNDGTFLVAQPNAGKVVRVNHFGKTLDTFDVFPAVPSDVTVKSTGQMVIADDSKGESMLNPAAGGAYWMAERSSNQITRRDPHGDTVLTYTATRPIDVDENRNGTLYVTELTNTEFPAQGHLRAIDSDGALLFSIPIPGLPLGLAVSQGRSLSPAPTNLTDTDLDGLPDVWESEGIDANFDGTIDLDLPALGADPQHKDLFVEIDAMTGRAPTPNAINRVRNAFAAVPNSLTQNPDGLDGITLHVTLDETNIPLDDFTMPGDSDWAQVEAHAWTEFDAIKATRLGTAAERASANWNAIQRARQQVFRYGLFADDYDRGGASGLAEIPGNDLMVTLGSANVPGGNEDQQAGTFMHELGHTLGLHHGGADDINYKPNYHSVMNYHWQFPNQRGNVGWTLDYSRETTATLNEGNLNETAGLGFAAGSVHDTQNHQVFLGGDTHLHALVAEVGTADFSQSDIDGDGDSNNDVGVVRDLNGGFDQNSDGWISSWERSPGESLFGHNDWENLVYDITSHHNFGDGIHQNAPLLELSRLDISEVPIQLDIPTMFVGSFQSIPVTIDPTSGLTMDDLAFTISDGPSGGEISWSRIPDSDAANPVVTLLAGYEVGEHQLQVRNKATGKTLAAFGYEITDLWAGPNEGPSLWTSSELSHQPVGEAYQSLPNKPQNQDAHPIHGTWDVAIVLVDTADQRFDADQVPAIRQLWLDEAVNGNLVDGKVTSVAHYFRELSQYRMDLKANVYGPVHLAGQWSDYFAGTGGAEALPNFYVACAAAADHLIDYRTVDSVVCVSQSVDATPRSYAWPVAHNNATIKVDDCAANNKCDVPMQFVSMPADWNTIQRSKDVIEAVNAGGSSISISYPDSSFVQWTADTTENPSVFQDEAAAGSATYATNASIDLSHPSIPTGTPMALFQTERWDSTTGDKMRWDFPVQPGWYDVNLYFAEIYGGALAVGARVFDAEIEGDTVLDDYDVFADVGGFKGVVKTFTVHSDANLDIDFTSVVSNPAVKAIEIRRTGRYIRGTLAHELGHNLGMGDIYPWNGHTAHVQNLTPGAWDLMAYERNLPHTLLPHKMRLGWVPDEDLRLFHLPTAQQAIDQTVTLFPVELGNAPAGLYSGIEIRLADGWNYYCEYRVTQPAQVGDQRLPTNDRVVCTDVAFDPNFDHPSRRKPIMLLRQDDDGDGPVLGNGQDYREVFPGTNNELRISVSGADGNQANVRVEFHSAKGLAPVPAGPDPSIQPWSTETWQSPDIEVRNAKSQTNPKFQNIPWENHINTVVARVQNNGTEDAPDVKVEFWVRDYTLGGTPEIFIGEDVRDVNVGQTVEFQTPWLPGKQGHYCIIAKIVPYRTPSPDPHQEITDRNNVAQSNYTQFISTTASPPSREGLSVQVGNPYDQPARVFVHVLKQSNPLYRTYLEHTWLDLGPNEVREVQVQVEYAYEVAPTEPFLEGFISQPNDLLLYATILPPDRQAESDALPLGGARIRVLTGRATRIDDFGVHDDNGVVGYVRTIDNAEPVESGQVLLAVHNDDGETQYVVATPDRFGRFQADLGVAWKSVVAYYLPADGYGESNSGDPLTRSGNEFPEGDVNRDFVVDARDIDLMFAVVAEGYSDIRYDLNQDDRVNRRDTDYLIGTILQTVVGDANLDGVFNSADLVLIFIAGEYEDRLAHNSGWATGDWNGDGEFNSSDLVLAFQIGAYSRTATKALGVNPLTAN